MAEMTNLRDLRKQKEKKRQPEVTLANELSALEEDLRTEGEIVPVPSAKVPMTRNSKKATAERELNAQGSNMKCRKLKDQSPGRSMRTETPIAWFTSVRHEGDQPSDYTVFEHRASIEAAWNYMAKFVMENNRVISSYEGELKSRNDVINMLQGQLSDAREATDSEKSTLAQNKKKIKALQASLAEKDEVIASLNAELELAKRSMARVRRETELSFIDKVQGHFIQIGEALQELRKGPMYRLILKGQTANNMSLVKDLQGSNPPVLADEMAALEEEMVTYGGATEEFENAFGEIMRLLLGEGSDSDDAEDSQGQPSELTRNGTGKKGGDEEDAECAG